MELKGQAVNCQVRRRPGLVIILLVVVSCRPVCADLSEGDPCAPQVDRHDPPVPLLPLIEFLKDVPRAA